MKQIKYIVLVFYRCVRNYHTFIGLKNTHKCIISQISWVRSPAQHGWVLTRLKSRCQVNMYSSGDSTKAISKLSQIVGRIYFFMIAWLRSLFFAGFSKAQPLDPWGYYQVFWDVFLSIGPFTNPVSCWLNSNVPSFQDRPTTFESPFD